MAVSSAGSDGPALHVIRIPRTNPAGIHSSGPSTAGAAAAARRGRHDARFIYGRACEQNCLPSGCTDDSALSRTRSLQADRDVEDPDADTDPNSLLPRWLPDGSAHDGWLAKVRADPGRMGAIALAAIAAIAVLVTIFTLMREQPAPVVWRSCRRSTWRHRRAAARPKPLGAAQSASRGERRGPRAHAGLVTLAPGARIADALKAAGGTTDGADTIGLNMARQVDDGEQIVVGIAPVKGQPAVLGSSVSPGSAAAGRRLPGSRPGQGRAPLVINLNTATVQQLLDAPPFTWVRAGEELLDCGLAGCQRKVHQR